jgi:thymidylate synthase (FAD)
VQRNLDDQTPICGAEALIKFAGQLCYYSFGANRTFNEKADEYFKNIKSSGHGSVCEHSNFSFLIYGVPRSFTHELVRHRAGAAFSQVSQRYVDGSTLRFVERPASAADPELHEMFINWIDLASTQYDKRAARLLELQQSGFAGLSGEKKRDLRKKINQDARACLPNEAEAPIFVTLNVRSLRHVIEMRAASPADVEIRAVAMTLYSMALSQAPLLFNDYTVVPQSDGFPAVSTEYRKV